MMNWKRILDIYAPGTSWIPNIADPALVRYVYQYDIQPTYPGPLTIQGILLIGKEKQDITNFTDFVDQFDCVPPEMINLNTNRDIICATDGACIGNGKANARASWGFTIDGLINKSGKVTGAQTNNRGELQAYINLCRELKQLGITKNIIIICDSKLTINTVNTWLQKWVAQDKVDQMKNPDLLHTILECKILAKFVYQKSHVAGAEKPQIIPDSHCQLSYGNIVWYNSLADKLAGDAI